jgi:hypothetical protein
VGVVPVALACGVWVSEARFWEALQRSKAPLLRKLIGFTALFLLVILLHDFYKSPWLFVTGYLFEAKADWDEKLRIMEGPFRALRMAFAVVFAAGLLGAFGWGERVLLGIGRGVKARFGWGRGLSAEEGVGKVVVTAWGGLRAVARPRLMLLTLGVVTALLVNYGYLTQITHHLTQKGLVDTYLEVKQGEEPLFNMQQSMTKTCKHAGECGKGQTCVSGRCVDEGVGFYLRDYAQVTQSALVDRLRKALAAELLPGLRGRMDAAKAELGAAERERTQRKAEVEAMQRQLVRLEALVGASADDGRFFAVLPRKQLSQINSQFRLLFPESGVKSEDRRNLAVLDNRSSQFVLISNQVRPGEVDQNPLNRLILKGKPSPQYQPEKRIKFEKGLEVVGYDVVLYDNLEAHLKEPPPAQQPLPVGVVGKKLVIIYYFYVGDRDGKPAEEVGTPGKTFGEDWQMFLHVDEGGNRINGDHYPGEGDFHTDTWVVGDYVRDIHVIEVETGSSSGIYTMWFGFFKGDQRLKVVDGEHQDNRAKLGQIRIQGTL